MKAAHIFLLLLVPMILFSGFSPLAEETAQNEVDDLSMKENDTRGQLFFDEAPYEYRSMWLEGYQIVNISEVRAVVDYARKYNFNCLSPLINGDYRGVFYNSTYFPKHPDVKWDFNPLMELIKEAHKYGIQVHPWWHTLINPYFRYDHPEWRCVSSSGYVNSWWINPAYPQARSYVKNITMEVITNYPIDGIKLDTIRYPSSAYSYDPYTISLYENSSFSDFNAFRRSLITKTLEEIYEAAMEEKPWLWLSTDIFSSSWGRMTGVFQEPESWADNGIVDYVTPMIYTTSVNSYRSSLQTDVDGISCPVVGGTYIYIPGNTAHGSVPNETVGISIMLQEVEAAQSIGAFGICAFAYKFLRQYPSYGQALKDGPFSVKARCPIKEQDRSTTRSRWYFERDHDREGWNLFDAGHFYPFGGVWSISGVSAPILLSPRINITSTGTNVIEISARIEKKANCTLRIFWGQMAAVMDEKRMIEKSMKADGDWHLYSIHLDDSQRYSGVISYIIIQPIFEGKGNITIDQITLHWMPRCIRECAYLGPFTIGSGEGLLDREFISDEGSHLPIPGENESGRSWKLFEMERDLLDFRFPLGRLTYTVIYSHIYIKSPVERTLQLRVGSSDGIKIYLNGKEVLRSHLSRSVSPDQNITDVILKKGFNSMMIKLAVYTHEFSYYVRFTDLENRSLEDLQFFDELPQPPSPEFGLNNGTWFDSSDIVIEWTQPASVTEIVEYEVMLDSKETFTVREPKLDLYGLKNGYHVLFVVPRDELGFTGEGAGIIFGTDTTTPIIDGPYTEGTYSTDISINWNWSLVNDPVSGLDRFEVKVGYGPIDGNTFSTLGPFELNGTEFTLRDHIVDGYIYYLEVNSYSKSGKMFSAATTDAVIVDLTPPPPPSYVTIDPVEIDNTTYLVGWDDVRDNIPGGVLSYEIMARFEDGRMVSMGNTSSKGFTFRRSIGSKPELFIRSRDRAGNIGELSGPFELPLEGPHANIMVDDDIYSGEVLTISSAGSYDPDGELASFMWLLNGDLKSTERDLKITLEKGVYNIELKVTDDTGMVDTREIILKVGYDPDQGLHSIRDLLIRKSMREKELPPINITIPVLLPQEEKKEDPLVLSRADIIDASLPLLFAVFLFSILVYLGYMLYWTRNYSGEDEFLVEVEEERESEYDMGGPAGWRKRAAVEAPILRANSTSTPMESLYKAEPPSELPRYDMNTGSAFEINIPVEENLPDEDIDTRSVIQTTFMPEDDTIPIPELDESLEMDEFEEWDELEELDEFDPDEEVVIWDEDVSPEGAP